MENVEKTIDELVVWLQEKVRDAHAKGLIFGLSGGIDSAVVAGLAKRAFPDTSLGVMMPCHSYNEDEEHGLLVAESLGLETKRLDLTGSFDKLLEVFGGENNHRLAVSNIKPRLRMTSLYYLGQINNYLVVGSTNKSEFTVGYFTKHADSGVDLMPLASFVKEEIRHLARALRIPEIVIDKPPTAGLWANQTDEDEMGFSYDVLDTYIKTGQGPKEIVDKIQRMNRNSHHKRVYPEIFVPNE